MAGILKTSQRSLSRLKAEDILSPVVTESTLQLAEVTSKGISVFEDEEVFRKWLTTPNAALEGSTPRDMLSTHYGVQMVLDILGRIEWGVFS